MPWVLRGPATVFVVDGKSYGVGEKLPFSDGEIEQIRRTTSFVFDPYEEAQAAIADNAARASEQQALQQKITQQQQDKAEKAERAAKS